MRPAAVALALAAFALSGCLTDSSATIEVDRDGGPTDRDSSASCPETARLDLSVTVRGGDVRVRVLDGEGAVAFNETYEVGDGGRTERGLFGAAGDWTLVVASDHFDGRVHATLACD